jgi:hypothetical protein
MAAIFESKHVLLEVASGEAVVGKKFSLCAQCRTLLVDGAGCSFPLRRQWGDRIQINSYLKL